MTASSFFKDRRIRTSLLGIGTDVLLSALKLGLALLTGSAALLADAYHSGTDFIVSLLLFVGLALRFFSERKGSEKSGSHLARKVEAGLGVFVSLIILYVPYELVTGLQNQSLENISNLWVGVIGVVLIMAILVFVSRLKSHVGKETNSIALEADGYHSYLDLFTTAAVLFSLIGMMVGIYLDEIVAIVISVLIGVAGLELFLASLRSLIKRDDLEQISLLQMIGGMVVAIPLGKALLSMLGTFAQFIRRYRTQLLVAMVGIYLLSGVRTVPFGQEGLQLRFGSQIGESLQPGLHYLLPAPVDRLQLVRTGNVQQIEAGSRVALQDSQAASRIWRELPSTSSTQDEADYLATADESLVDIRFQVLYRVRNTSSLFAELEEVDPILFSFTQGVLWEQTALTTYEALTDRTTHAEFSNKVVDRIIQRASELGIELEVLDAYIESVQPPATVVTTYRDLINADQEREQRINVAIAESLQNLPDARAQITTELAESNAEAYEQLLAAEVDGMQINNLSSIHENHRNAFEFNARMDALVNSLQNRALKVVDSDIDPRTLNAWHSYDSGN